jgi:hypothetical protein
MENKVNWISSLVESNDIYYFYGIHLEIKRIVEEIVLSKNISKLQLAKSLKLNRRSFYYWLRGDRPIPTKALLKILKSSKYKRDLILENLQEKVESISAGTGTGCKKVKLPCYISNDLCYIVGYLYGDGCLKSSEFTIYLSDEYEEQIRNFEKLMFNIFLIKSKIIVHKNLTEIYIYSKVIWKFFNIIFDMPIGYKRDLTVPKIIDNQRHLLSFARGFLDADAGLPRLETRKLRKNEDPRIEVSQSESKILDDIGEILKMQGITYLGTYYNKNNLGYRIIIRGKDNLKLANNISIFRHPIKAKRLKMVCSNFN